MDYNSTYGTPYNDKTFRSTKTDRADRNVRSEVMNKDFDPAKVIDAYEQAKGIRPRPDMPSAQDYEFKSIVLDPEQPKDGEMLNLLMNDSKYIINLYKDNWTPQGTYRVFIIYGKKRDKTPATPETT